jgi:hypothetical protein
MFMVGGWVEEGLGSYAGKIVWFLVWFIVGGWLVGWGWFSHSYNYVHIS